MDGVAARSERLEAVVRLRGEGLSGRQIAERLGVTRRTVCRDLEAAGHPPKGDPPPQPEPATGAEVAPEPEPEPEPAPVAAPPVRAAAPLVDDLDGLPAWHADAACAGVPDQLGRDPWFGGDPAEALAVCQACPVTDPCLEMALAEGYAVGVWGGTTPQERATIRRSHTAA